MPMATGEAQTSERPAEVTLTVGSFVKLLLVLGLAWALYKLFGAFCLLVIAVLVAITLSPVMTWLEARGLSHGWAVAVIAILVLAVLGAASFLVIPPLFEQVEQLAGDLPAVQKSLSQHLGGGHAWRSKIVSQLLEIPASPEASKWLHPLTWAPPAMGVMASLAFILVLAFYLLLDGKNVVAWLLAFVPRAHRKTMSEMVPEVFAVVMAYMQGQVITSVLFACFAFGVLTFLKVPAALPLALLAGICDVLPLVGIFLATAPAALLALTVSPAAALIVMLTYGVYHLIEAYLLVPRIYGSRLRLSTLAILIALTVGATLYGVVGALLVLPLVAAYPVIEKYWLKEHLGKDTVAVHSALHQAEGEVHEEIVDAVLAGEKHHGIAAAAAVAGTTGA